VNGILLPTNLHRSFDASTWVLMAVEGQQLVAYVVRTVDVLNQFAEFWHYTDMHCYVVEFVGSDDEFGDDVVVLRDFCFISTDAGGTMFEMHALVQLATWKWLEGTGKLE
jgi:hypothetical protein